jgi:hypothetical protein
MTQMKEQRPDHLQENTGIASLPMEGRATSNWAVIDAGGQAGDRARGSHVTTFAISAYLLELAALITCEEWILQVL